MGLWVHNGESDGFKLPWAALEEERVVRFVGQAAGVVVRQIHGGRGAFFEGIRTTLMSVRVTYSFISFLQSRLPLMHWLLNISTCERFSGSHASKFFREQQVWEDHNWFHALQGIVRAHLNSHLLLEKADPVSARYVGAGPALRDLSLTSADLRKQGRRAPTCSLIPDPSHTLRLRSFARILLNIVGHLAPLPFHFWQQGLPGIFCPRKKIIISPP